MDIESFKDITGICQALAFGPFVRKIRVTHYTVEKEYAFPNINHPNGGIFAELDFDGLRYWVEFAVNGKLVKTSFKAKIIEIRGFKFKGDILGVKRVFDIRNPKFDSIKWNDLVAFHHWQWRDGKKELPDFCYCDIVTSSWNFEYGMTMRKLLVDKIRPFNYLAKQNDKENGLVEGLEYNAIYGNNDGEIKVINDDGVIVSVCS